MAQNKTKKQKEKVVKNSVPLYDDKGSKTGTMELDAKLFNGQFSHGVIHEAVVMYEANKRVGQASTKQRDEVEGGGKKPWRQKGTGRARFGSIRNPLWRGGGKVFGPHPRSFKYQIPVKAKKTALLHSLNSKIADDSFGVIKEVTLENHKTKGIKAILDKTKIKGNILFAVDKKDRNMNLAARNLACVTLLDLQNLNALDVLKHKNFLITEKGVGMLTQKLRD